MIVFFFVEEDVTTQILDSGYGYIHEFKKIPDINNNKISFGNLYFSTSSNYSRNLLEMDKTIGKDRVKVVHPAALQAHPQFPLSLGHGELEKKIQPILKTNNGMVKICIVNAMSNAIGDHLIGMRAFDIFYDQITKYIPSERLEIAFFQLNPQRMMPITRQSKSKIKQLYLLPNTMDKFIAADGFFDLGGLIVRKGFDTQPMIDFFLEVLSVDKKSIPDEEKRMKFEPNEDAQKDVNEVLNQLKKKKKPILLFHHLASTMIRSMDKENTFRILNDILSNSDYTVISCLPLEFNHRRFVNLRKFSRTVDHFAAIISNCDAIMTVDTCTYHLADAFNIPTVAFFTTISPEYRVKYYPTVEGIMLEEPGGMIHGLHKADDNSKEHADYVKTLWAKVDAKNVLDKLKGLQPS